MKREEKSRSVFQLLVTATARWIAVECNASHTLQGGGRSSVNPILLMSLVLRVRVLSQSLDLWLDR